MISIFINRLAATTALLMALNACTDTSGFASAGTSIDISAAPSPSVAAAQDAGAKTFNNDLGDSITLTRAYLVIANTELETDCGPDFSAAIDELIDFIIPGAHAHTEATPTATGEPHVINLLEEDNHAHSIGSLSPPTADYCGLHIELLAADEDALGLPSADAGPDMIGRSLYIEGSYRLAGGATGVILIDSGAALSDRHLSVPVTISSSSPNSSIALKIQYDTWFNAIDLAALEAETSTSTRPTDPQVLQLLQNIPASIH